jgi:DNA-binding CsgD family transcriptional regulator/tetratricopeptide (TPR) repeat protein
LPASQPLPAAPYPLGAGTMLTDRAAECGRLDRLLLDVRGGESAVLMLVGEPGIGKTALLEYGAERAHGYRIIRAVGVEPEMELPYAGLQLLCAPLLDGLGRLPPRQAEALGTAVGLTDGSRPDRFLVGLATLTLFSDAAEALPLLCIVDDAQWLDRSSAQVLAFVARRLEAESIALLLAEREAQGLDELEGLPELRIEGLSAADARELLGSVISGRLDEAVRERIVAETRGNPLALLELPRGMSPLEMAGGFGVTSPGELTRRIEKSFRERVQGLPSDSRQELLVAAAEPIGDPTLLWRAAAELGIPTEAAQPLESEGLLSLGPRVTFRHPLLRSAIYGAATNSERRCVHRALAGATDPSSDPDRRAWHRAQAAEGPDEDVAQDLERSAARARDRGGIAASAAFFEKAALLTIDSQQRAKRALAAAAAKHEAGDPSAALRLLVTAEMGPLDDSQLARLERLRAEVAFASRRGNDAPQLLLRAARRLEPLEPQLSRETYLEALVAAIFAGELGVGRGIADVADAVRASPPAQRPPRKIDRLLDSLVVRFTDGYTAAVGPLKQALEAFRDGGSGDETTRWLWLACRIAGDLWDDETWHALTTREVQLAREAGAFTILPYALTYRAIVDVHCGEFAAASALVDEADAIASATGNPRLAYTSLALVAWRGQEDRAVELFEAARQDALERGEGITITTASFAAAVLYNGLGRYQEALTAAQDASGLDELGLLGWSLVELIEAAARSGEPATAALAFQRLSQRTRLSGTDWALGIEARSLALLSDGQAAEDLYLKAIERLGRSRIKSQFARAQLVYGEWLRRQGRRVDARGPLRAAYKSFAAMGAEAFAERAHRELVVTGERARSRTPDTRDELTPREIQIALLARDGLSNPEIGARLFISPRTVEYHLHRVFGKLGISSRTELHLVLADRGDAARAALALRQGSATRAGDR